MAKDMETLTGFMYQYETDYEYIDHVLCVNYPNHHGKCPKCGTETNFSRTSKRTIYTTRCGHYISALYNTPFWYSSVPLAIWFLAISLHLSNPDWIGVGRLMRLTGLDENTAQRMLQKIRATDKPERWINNISREIE